MEPSLGIEPKLYPYQGYVLTVITMTADQQQVDFFGSNKELYLLFAVCNLYAENDVRQRDFTAFQTCSYWP